MADPPTVPRFARTGAVPRTHGERVLSRRAALRLLAAGATAGAAAGCDRPREELVPYVAVPEHELPGTPLDYATTLGSVHGSGVGVIVTTYTGRPTKIEGNAAHPASLGATGVHAQAALVDLYDPSRSQAPRRGAGTMGLDAFFAELERQVAPLRARRGAGLCLVTPAVASPTAARLLGELFASLPEARWFRNEPVARDTARTAAVAALGAPLEALYRLERARRVVTLDADLLNGMPGHLAHARRWAAARAVPRADMPRLYAVEAQPTATGIRADQRLALPAARVVDFAFGLAAALGVPGGLPFAGSAFEQRWLEALARDLGAQREASVVVPGPYLPAAVHELCHWINAALAATDGPLQYVAAIEVEPAAPAGDLAALCNEIRAGRVTALAIVGRNPVYDAPNGAELAELLAHVPFTAHVGLRRDETGASCAWHVPLLHDLESWGDLRAFDGTVSLTQPVVPPLVAGLTALDLYAALAGGTRTGAQRDVRDTFERLVADGGEERWRAALRAGVVDGTATARVTAAPRGAPPAPPGAPAVSATPAAAAAALAPGSLELQLRPCAKLWDGRYAANAWLQELPDPLTTRQWGNALELSTATAAALSAATGDELELALPSGVAVRGAAYVSPAHPDGAVTATLGYGRVELKGRETRSSFNAFALRTAGTQWSVAGASLRRTGARAELVLRQPQETDAGRAPARRGTLAAYLAAPDFLASRAPNVSLYPERRARGDYRWAMSIDLNRCIGCAACTIACQAENNIPVVGREQAALGRSMHWIRVDRYYRDDGQDAAAARIDAQPVPCMHCENAPCEYVCPVGATVHDSEGLNVMVYNRCIGTRDCSQNCPYKVRRFNFLDWNYSSGEDWAPLHNPNVTVRSRGVMEKCSYCVQRISAARQTAEIEGRRIRDGEVRTACQAVCPTDAIVFGDLDTAGSAVGARRADPLDYALLAELNTRPRTTYRARIDNVNPEIDAAEDDA